MEVSPVRTILLLLPVFAASNSLAASVTGVPIFKVLVGLILLFTVLAYGSKAWMSSRLLLGFFAMLSLFFAYAVGSATWAPDSSLAFSKINSIGVALMLVYALCASRAYKKATFRFLIYGWIAAVAFTTAFAAFELAVGRNFFGNERFSDVTTYGQVVLSTFHNPNNFSIFLSLAMPMVLYAVLKSAGWRKFLLTGLWLTALAFLLVAASRMALLVATIQLAVFIFLTRSSRIFKGAAMIGALAVMASAFVLSSRISEKVGSLVEGGDVSALTRVGLVLDGIWMARESDWMGVGAGNFPYYIEHRNPPYEVRGVVVPHNLWIEILSEYGIGVFVAFTLYLAYVGRQAVRLSRRRTRMLARGQHFETMTLLMLLVSYPVAVVSPSHYVADPVNWLFLTTIVLWAKRLSDEQWSLTRIPGGASIEAGVAAGISRSSPPVSRRSN